MYKLARNRLNHSLFYADEPTTSIFSQACSRSSFRATSNLVQLLLIFFYGWEGLVC